MGSGETARSWPGVVGGVSLAGAGADPGAGGGIPAGRPRLGLSAGLVFGSIAAGWQFSKCCNSIFCSPPAECPVRIFKVDFVGFSTIGIKN